MLEKNYLEGAELEMTKMDNKSNLSTVVRDSMKGRITNLCHDNKTFKWNRKLVAQNKA